MFTLSQRGFTTLIVFAVAILTAIYAGANHLLPAIDVHDLSGFLSANFLTIVTPTVFVLTTLNQFYDALDEAIAAGKLVSSDIGALFSMSAFYVTVIACLSGIFQIFGIAVINPNDQAILVNVLLSGATLLMRSFSNRTPAPPVPTPPAPPA